MEICREESQESKTMLSDLKPGETFDFHESVEYIIRDGPYMLLQKRAGTLRHVSSTEAYYVKIKTGRVCRVRHDHQVERINGCFVVEKEG